MQLICLEKVKTELRGKTMTVKELKEKLNQFPDNCIVVVPKIDWVKKGSLDYAVVENVAIGVNEFDNVVFIDDYVEDDEDEE